MIRYISGVDNLTLQAAAFEHDIGLLVTPDTARLGSKNFGYAQHISKYPVWAGDNGCFAKPDRRQEDFLAWLGQLPKQDALFVPAFDVVGNAKLTLERSTPMFDLIRSLGFRPAFVAQDGIDDTTIPWAQFDALFIGGSTEFKLGPTAEALTREAKLRGKWVHMGRVNSFKRLKLANSWGCDSADGTYLQFTGPKGVATIAGWISKLKAEA